MMTRPMRPIVDFTAHSPKPSTMAITRVVAKNATHNTPTVMLAFSNAVIVPLFRMSVSSVV